jgi:hypothetical protein
VVIALRDDYKLEPFNSKAKEKIDQNHEISTREVKINLRMIAGRVSQASVCCDLPIKWCWREPARTEIQVARRALSSLYLFPSLARRPLDPCFMAPVAVVAGMCLAEIVPILVADSICV